MIICVLPENNLDNLGFLRHDHRRLPMVNDPVPERRARLIAAALRLFHHAAGNLSRKPDRVIFIHPFNDPLDQAAKRSICKRLRDTDHIHIMLFLQERLIDDTFLLITGKTAEFPDKDCIHRMIRRLRLGDHLLKLRALLGFPAGDTELIEDIGYNDPILQGVILQELRLRVRRKFLLTGSRDSDIAITIFSFHDITSVDFIPGVARK